MAAYQAEAHVERALASASGQTLRDLEAIVVDDGSADATAARVEAAARRDGRIRLLRLPRNRGQAAALNAGLDAARGRYAAILDADDEATPDRLARQVAALERDPGLVLVGGAVRTFCDRRGEGGPVWRYAEEDGAIRARSLFKSEVISGAMTFDRERLRAHGIRFDERLRLGADWALSLEAMRVGRVANVPEIVMRYRIHPGQGTAGMIDDVTSDSARIRVDALASAGVRPTEAELRTHLAVSPCNYWPFGAHPHFEARRGTIAAEARAWLARLLREAVRVPRRDLAAYLDEIAARVEAALAGPAAPPGTALASFCPAADPGPCPDVERCRRGAPVGSGGPAAGPARMNH